MKTLIFLGELFLIALVLNAAWEFWHVRFYTTGGTFQSQFSYPWFLIIATLWDACYVVMVYLLLAFVKHDLFWVRTMDAKDVLIVAAVGCLTAIYVERRSLSIGKWAYNATMPIVPYLGVGLTPFLQLAILSPLTFWIVEKLL